MFIQKNDIAYQTWFKYSLPRKVLWNNKYNEFIAREKKWALQPNVWHIKQPNVTSKKLQTKSFLAPSLFLLAISQLH